MQITVEKFHVNRGPHNLDSLYCIYCYNLSIALDNSIHQCERKLMQSFEKCVQCNFYHLWWATHWPLSQEGIHYLCVCVSITTVRLQSWKPRLHWVSKLHIESRTPNEIIQLTLCKIFRSTGVSALTRQNYENQTTHERIHGLGSRIPSDSLQGIP